MISTRLIQLARYLGLIRQSHLATRKAFLQRTLEHNDAQMSPVQRATARAARKNPWILAG
uniref:hypothetical protein n=1 Tax=Marinobacterium profundum TaxID=1714300 RepID=UPI000A70EA84|nr:hypothetical protein [Marinobacterium profundum]